MGFFKEFGCLIVVVVLYLALVRACDDPTKETPAPPPQAAEPAPPTAPPPVLSDAELEVLVSDSEEFQQHRLVFMVAARSLIESGRCTVDEFRQWSGWTRSPTRRSAYFIYCGGFHRSNRIYLDVTTGEFF